MKIHFISIGGSVMHQLAIALKQKGYQITGTDDEIFEPSRSNLQKAGLLPATIGWDPSFITPDLDAVILGMHARDDNPELQKARSLGLPVYSFPEYIYQESRQKTRVVVGGSHGKTTTTSMIMHVLKEAQKQFDYLVGARLPGFSQSVNITDAPLIVCEGDEYPASVIEKRPKFHFLFPHIAVLTGIAWDHINVFPTFDNYLEQFRIFVDKIEPNGALIYNQTDPVLAKLVEDHPSVVRKLPYSVPEHEINDGTTIVKIEGKSVALRVFGDHNLLNLNAAYLVCKELGIHAEAFLNAISTFTGAANRLEVLASGDNTIVFRDFAHAPSKVKATVEAVRAQFPGRRLIALLELHTYSSLNRDFLPNYASTLDLADEAAVFYSAHALEIKKMPALESESIYNGFKNDKLTVLTTKSDLQNWLDSRKYDNCVLLLMSSGSYDGINMLTFANQITGGTPEKSA